MYLNKKCNCVIKYRVLWLHIVAIYPSTASKNPFIDIYYRESIKYRGN